ncbi:MAG TPA: serine hydrolase [Pyrinomonadaceae bacterium]|nr:serine hydrolase [Pyrinomonadaceae bacterium]
MASVRAVAEPAGAVRNDATVRERGRLIDDYLSRTVPFDVAGVFLVAKDGKVILEKGYGYADREKNIAYSPETVFDIGSLTKQFTAAAILKLEEQGKLRVADPLSKYLPGVPEDKAAITLHHLLTHSAGLQDVFGGDYEVMTRDGIVRAALDSKLMWSPGTRYRYSNSGYSLLGVVIELVSGMSYERFLRTHLFEPAGLKKTGYRLATWSPRELAVGYRNNERWGTPLDKAWAEDGPWWNLRANGGLLSTVGDLYRWGQALAGNKILSEASKRKLFHPHVATDDAGLEHYGYGWGVSTTSRKTKLISHNGGNGVFFADFHNYVDEGLVVILGTGAMATPAAYARNAAINIALGQEQPLPPAAGQTPTNMERYAGRYRTAAGAEIEVTLMGGRLAVHPASVGGGSLLTPLAPVGAAGLDAAKTRLVNIINGLAEDKPGAMLEALHERYNPKVEAEFWKEWFGEMRKQFGEYRGVEVVGATERDGALTLYAVIYFDRASRPVRGLVGRDGKLFVSNSATGTLPRSYRLAPVGTDKFSTWNFTLSRATTLAFQAGAGAALPERVEISAGGAAVSATRVK